MHTTQLYKGIKGDQLGICESVCGFCSLTHTSTHAQSLHFSAESLLRFLRMRTGQR